MTHQEQQDAFYKDLTKLIDLYISEFNMTTADAVGCLQIKTHEIISSALSEEE